MYELQIQVWVVTFVLILGRVGAFVATLPLFSGRNLPNTVKIGLSLTLSAMWFAAYGIDPPETVWRLAQQPHWLALAQATAREILFGGILGITFGLLLMPARIAGAYIAQEMGLTMATLSDPGQQQSSNIVAQLFDSIGVLLLFALDIHHLILHSVHLAFQRWPCGSPLGSIPPEALAMAPRIKARP
jgi:flagellar biosynthesis protein FliR